MAPLGIQMSEDETYEPKKRQKDVSEKKADASQASPSATADDKQKSAQDASREAPQNAPQAKADAKSQPDAAPQPSVEPEKPATSGKSATDEYRLQMRNAAVLQAKQAEILQRQSEQLDYSQKLLERYEAILARHEEKLNES